MARNFTQLYLHLVWATVERHPLITPALQPPIYGVIQEQADKLGAVVIAVGGMRDHVHVLARIHATVSVSTLVGRLKGASSHLVKQVLRSPDPFQWQGGYGAFSVSKSIVPRVRDYVLNQERHHRDGTLSRSLEATEDPEDAGG